MSTLISESPTLREFALLVLASEGGIRIYCCYITESDDMDGATTKKFIHLVRHGKYLGSSVGEVLSPIGIRQAELTGGRLQQLVSQGDPRRRLASIMHSSTPRAVHTAGIITKCFPNVSVQTSKLLCGKDPSSPTAVIIKKK